VAEVRWKETDALIIVHVEPQSTRQVDFNSRMFEYYSLLSKKFQKQIIPIAVYSYDDRKGENELIHEVGGFTFLHFRYLTLHLKKLDWRKFIHRKNPVSAAMMSKMGYNEKETVQVKVYK